MKISNKSVKPFVAVLLTRMPSTPHWPLLTWALGARLEKDEMCFSDDKPDCCS